MKKGTKKTEPSEPATPLKKIRPANQAAIDADNARRTAKI